MQSISQHTAHAERAAALVREMTLAEKIGQMTLVEKNSIPLQDIERYFIGGVLSGGGGYPSPNMAENWGKMVDEFQKRSLKTRLAIPMIYGVDAVHGHNNVVGATIFPHNIGLGASRNAELVRKVARATAVEMAATGIYWNYAPALSVPQDIRWGRTFEGFSERTELVTELSVAYLEGLQNPEGSPDLAAPTGVLGTPKHFVGDGGTSFGSSTTFIGVQYLLDQGVTQGDEAMLRKLHLAPYLDAIKAGALCVMASFSSWGGMKMHANRYLLTDVLKGELGFSGFIVTDWEAINQITPDYYEAVVTSINAGIDMNMVPFDYKKFIHCLTRAVNHGDVSIERIDDAVRRILLVKMEMGLFDQPYSQPKLLPEVGSAAHRQLAREAVAQSAVLLKNEGGLLPLSKDTRLIFVAGEANDLGLQSGGWSIEWQGKSGPITDGTTLLQALEESESTDSQLVFDRFGNFDDQVNSSGVPLQADVAVVVLAEQPYAEGKGDRVDLKLSKEEQELVARVRARAGKLVIILMSGRPLIIGEALAQADAFVAAFWPGSEAAGLSDLLLGDKPFTGKLSYTWPRSMEHIPLNGGSAGEPLFPFGFGLSTEVST
ncbi:MAG TPA: glycoside hydrolase family 3 N-terminal domain-containing protein [Anaerolineales bacterium]|nr:glycoside hydrolase family 3 N-terminal domain-containing protein [Anaerolineales bacterium]HRQ91674.1 glycoside hydrolase family 3 N-terminal domain-containing protein [Anaerolineales bacterium]